MVFELIIKLYKDSRVECFIRLNDICCKNMEFINIGLILLLGIVAFANSLSVPLQYDDYPTLRNAAVNMIEAGSLFDVLRKSRWVVDVSFALNRYWHGEQVLGYHLFNLAIHLSSAVVVYLTVAALVNALKQTSQLCDNDQISFIGRFMPLAVALLFVCHPVQTQAVTYIAQRYTTLSVFLYLCALLAFLKARQLYNNLKLSHFLFWIFGYVIATLLAMFSKEIAFTIPLMVLLLEVAIFRGQLLKNKFFIALQLTLFAVIPVHKLSMLGNENIQLLKGLQQAATETSVISRGDYFLTQIRVVATYLRLMILPVGQNLDYDYPIYHSLFDFRVLTALTLHLGLFGAALLLFMRSRSHLSSGNSETGILMRLASLGIFWFYLSLAVESSFIPIRDVIYEHRLYLPSIGFFITAGACFAMLALSSQNRRRLVSCVVTLLCLFFSATSIARNRIWQDETVMWQDVLAKSPNKARVRYNVGFLYFRKIKPELALPYLVGAIELDGTPDQYWLTLNSAVSLLPRFTGRSATGQEYLKTYNIINEPYFRLWKAVSLNNLGLAYESLGDMTRARSNYTQAIINDHNFVLAWYNLALIATRLKDKSAAELAKGRLATLKPELLPEVNKVIEESFGR